MIDNCLRKNIFLIKEHIGMFKAANNYDIYDPETGEIIMKCREPNLGFFTKLLRFSDYKRMTPFEIFIKDRNDKTLVKVSRGISIFLSDVSVSSEGGEVIGSFKQRFSVLKSRFDILDKSGNLSCYLKGSFSGWDFRFVRNDIEIAKITKKWSGIGKELFTSADNYILEINESVSVNDEVRKLVVAAVMCIDMVIKE